MNDNALYSYAMMILLVCRVRGVYKLYLREYKQRELREYTISNVNALVKGFTFPNINIIHYCGCTVLINYLGDKSKWPQQSGGVAFFKSNLLDDADEALQKLS